FFFFQAEDGIRYRNVTGVQTCALPIFAPACASAKAAANLVVVAGGGTVRWSDRAIPATSSQWRARGPNRRDHPGDIDPGRPSAKIGRASCRVRRYIRVVECTLIKES